MSSDSSSSQSNEENSNESQANISENQLINEQEDEVNYEVFHNLDEDQQELKQSLEAMGYSLLEIQKVILVNIIDLNLALDYIQGDIDQSHFELPQECPICQTSFNDTDPYLIQDCNDAFCQDCLKAYLEYRISENQVLSMPCPNHNCPNQIQDQLIIQLISPDLVQKYNKFKENMELNLDPNLRWCPQPDCTGYARGNIKQTQLQCSVCQFEYCYYCCEKYHDKSQCKEFKDLQFDQWSKSNGVKFCPNCKRRIEKLDGCDHMTCPLCRYEWCWLCGQTYFIDHFSQCEALKQQRKIPKLNLVFICFASPLILVFAGIVVSLMLLRQFEIDNIGTRIRHRKLLYFFIAFIGLICTPLIYAAPILLPFYWLFDNNPQYSHYAILRALSNYIVWTFISIFLGILLVPFLYAAIILSVPIAHLLSYYLFCKLIYIKVRKCINPEYMQNFNYANY